MGDTVIGLIFNNWQRKLFAVLGAIFIWWFVNNSIIDTKTIPNVPIRIVNLPPNKTVVGLLPNRLLSKRVTLTLSGTKDVIQELDSGDVEVLLDGSTATSDEWVVHITKKNLVSLNPALDLAHHVTQVEHTELVLTLSPLITAKVPIKISPPNGTPPPGYEFLDIWPQKLMQTVTGSEEEMRDLTAKGVKLVFNLNDITTAELDALSPANGVLHDDEISFPVPDKWKKVMVNQTLEQINDPDAKHLTIDFLRKGALRINKEIPIRIFYPLKTSDVINEQTYPLVDNKFVREKNGLKFLDLPLYAHDVSRLFIDIISDNLEINLVAAPKNEREHLLWSLEVIDPRELEDTYVAYLQKQAQGSHPSKRREVMLRQRFQDFMNRLALYTENGEPLHLDAALNTNAIELNVQAE